MSVLLAGRQEIKPMSKIKFNFSSLMSNNKIDEWYNLGLQNGAIGGKLVGAGGGGFLMFYAKNKHLLIKKMKVFRLMQRSFLFSKWNFSRLIQKPAAGR